MFHETCFSVDTRLWLKNKTCVSGNRSSDPKVLYHWLHPLFLKIHLLWLGFCPVAPALDSASSRSQQCLGGVPESQWRAFWGTPGTSWFVLHTITVQGAGSQAGLFIPKSCDFPHSVTLHPYWPLTKHHSALGPLQLLFCQKYLQRSTCLDQSLKCWN